MQYLVDELKDLFFNSLTLGIYFDQIDKEQKVFKISVPETSWQPLYGKNLAIQFRDNFHDFFPDYRVQYRERKSYWSEKDSERYFLENVDMIYNTLNRIAGKD